MRFEYRRTISCLTVLTFVLAPFQIVSAQNWNLPDDAHKSYGRVIEHKEYSSGLVLYPGRSELPQYLDPHPNDITVSHHYERVLREIEGGARLTVIKPSERPTQFEFDLRSSAYLNSHLAESNVLSYLFYENGKVVYDKLAPSERYTFDVSDQALFRSASVGKSFVSYILGHAICEGYVESIDHTIADWPLMAGTLYQEKSLIDLLNMRAGDQNIVTEADGFIESGRWFNSYSLASFAENELRDTTADRAVYNYNGLITNILMNYVHFKTGEDWLGFLDKIFGEKVGISERLVFKKAGAYKASDWYSAYASRYDYLRVARAIMEDWQADTCVGQYLKEVYSRRESKPKDAVYSDRDNPSQMRQRRGIWARSYGGQFHFDWYGMNSREIIGMDGYGGQSILIDPNESRIIVINAAHTNYDWYELMYRPMLKGTLKN